MKARSVVAVLLCLFNLTFTADGESTTLASEPREVSASYPVEIPTHSLQVQGPATDPTVTRHPDVHPTATRETLSEVDVEPDPQSEGEEQLQEKCAGATSPETMQVLGKAVSDFGITMFQKILTETKKPNVIISPLSIMLALAQLTLGSANKTERDLVNSLHLASPSCSHHTLHTAVTAFNRQAGSIASTIYLRKALRVKPDFLMGLERFYRSKPQLLSGQPSEDTKSINRWVEQMTSGKIKNFLSAIPVNADLILINAINFKGLWKVQFDPQVTGQDSFFLGDGTVLQVPMMKHMKYPVSIQYDKELENEVIWIPFRHNMSFIVVKPQNSSRLNDVVNNLNLSDIKAPHKLRTMLVRVPRLNIDFGTELKNILEHLGLGSIFSHPDLSRISDQPLIVSSIKHKSTLELREEGAQAAAGTSVSITRSLLQCNINRPFFFMIRDEVSGIPLFLGTVKRPKPIPLERQASELEETLDTADIPEPK
ncbi:serpin peptidase inhibitor, clade F (alpha-2 antiplasmin, pigment epithelium derived factor), member 2b [Mobula birostris]|uniref:serpin peptidase inhibitor, clade F (alpha-2 antiplasmin, pigment epithelium derived factor), member 2b n=1 Tax=Mobula birostris TaxID=1983395 RepID=UPI003B283EBE